MKRKGLLAAMISALAYGCGDSGGVNVTAPSPTGVSTNAAVTASGNVITQNRQVGAFQAVSIGVPGRLRVEQTGAAGAGSLTVTGDEAVLAVITSEIVDSVLTIGLAPDTDLRLEDPLGIDYLVTVGELQRLEVNGTVEVEVVGVAASRFEARIDGASRVTVSGTTDRLDLFMFGSSRYQGEALDSREAEVDVSGTSFALVNVRDSLSGRVTGAGVVRYRGAPQVSVTVSGTGTVGPE